MGSDLVGLALRRDQSRGLLRIARNAPPNMALQQTGLSVAPLPLAPAAERRYVGQTEMGELLQLLRTTRAKLALPENDFVWSSWETQATALDELDRIIAGVAMGRIDDARLDLLFAPTGPIQEVSLASGWGDEFLELAQRYDAATTESV